ncbi:MAG TPA: hypothetical protein VGO09_06655 [Flavisolibacter sp.]|nr:hypothetical protein [Flavisolibacter sp.]
MFRLGLVLICSCIIACSNNKSGITDENGFSYEVFANKFQGHSLPYQVADTSILKNTDTVVIKSKTLTGFITDSLKNKLFGKNSKVKYLAMVKFNKPKAESYYIIKGVNGNRRAVILLVFDKNDQFASAFTLLKPGDPHISQIAYIDKSYSVTLSKIKKKANGTPVALKEVYQYNPDQKKFSLIMTDAQGEGIVDLINPIDSFPKKNKLSGDYFRDNSSFISVRDGRHPNQLMVFIHFENANGCSGEFKGELLLTSPNYAIYRQGGDPCVLSFRFSPLSITLKEDEGCGSHRGLDCLFQGSFHKKKEKTKTKRKKRSGF